ncbi:hypothetical protein NQ176_g4463 [Zarea fungicola]|uniref:Uncharacterized protein n=1 Tax=Zarea fungicola TaxID=93591 RepID=A0ACC1NDC5_9HYPO|nr:hypothetical protein NQ176_g4463 [Lecanicillium fungicola]
MTEEAAFTGILALLHVVGDSFHETDTLQLSWLVAGYSLTVGTFILFSGRLGDVFGYKRMVMVGFSWFSLWSVLVGVSVYTELRLAIFFRVMQGIGPALCLPNALAILGSVYPPGHRKAMVFAFFGAVAPLGAVCGGIFSSLLALAWWPWAMWALGIWLAICALASAFLVPDMPRAATSRTTWKAWSDALDLPGTVLGTASLVLFNFAWIQAPIDGWGTVVVIIPLILGLALFFAFAFVEFRLSPTPILPFAAVNADVAFVLVVVACGWATFGIWTLYLFQLMEDVRGLSPLLSTAWLSPAAVAGGCAAVLTGNLLGRWQIQPPIVMTLALLAFSIGIILTATALPDQIYWGQMFFSMIIMPFGMDMSFPAATLILSNAVPREHQGVGASLVNTVVNYGIALGVGFAGTVEVHVRESDKTIAYRLQGYKAALYMGIGLSGLGLGICLAFIWRTSFHTR